jgi:hypothetical protein
LDSVVDLFEQNGSTICTAQAQSSPRLNASAKFLINHYESIIYIRTQCFNPQETLLNKDKSIHLF